MGGNGEFKIKSLERHREEGIGSLYLVNWTGDVREITVRVRSTLRNEVFEESYVLEPDESKTELEIGSGGRYEVTVSLENGYERTQPVRMNGCSDQEVTIRPEDSNHVAIESKNC